MTADRARSFGAVAAEYAGTGPGYPAPAVEWACHGVGGRLLDLAAGTGKLTGELLGRGEPIAVEPDPPCSPSCAGASQAWTPARAAPKRSRCRTPRSTRC
ncbi:MAG TPA: hypothetical protein VNO83_14595 [Pseudonocardia sp.]|nr:hypothetical protein [Pseudonocardia sp.]